MKKLFYAFTIVSSLTFFSCENADEIFTQKQSNNYKSDVAGQANSARKSFALDSETSLVKWKGYGVGIDHTGSFAVTSENIEIVNGKVKKGSFTIPIASIRNFDLPDELKPVLLDHLKSPDFFNIVRYPEAVFTFEKVTPLVKPVEGSIKEANYLVSGDFTMLGQTHPISFPARIEVEENKLKVEATLKIDRTQWGMNYGADPALGDHYIYPEVELHLKLNGDQI